MFKLRGCPKCHGDLFLGEDIYGKYLSCVQCGRYFSTEASVRVVRPVPDAQPAGPPVLADFDLAA